MPAAESKWASGGTLAAETAGPSGLCDGEKAWIQAPGRCPGWAPEVTSPEGGIMTVAITP